MHVLATILKFDQELARYADICFSSFILFQTSYEMTIKPIKRPPCHHMILYHEPKKYLKQPSD